MHEIRGHLRNPKNFKYLSWNVMWRQWYTSHFPSWPPPLQYRSAHWSASRPYNESGFSFIVVGQYQSCLFANLVWLMRGSVYVLVNTNCSTLLIIVVISLPQRVQFFKFSVFFQIFQIAGFTGHSNVYIFQKHFFFQTARLGKSCMKFLSHLILSKLRIFDFVINF